MFWQFSLSWFICSPIGCVYTFMVLSFEPKIVSYYYSTHLFKIKKDYLIVNTLDVHYHRYMYMAEHSLSSSFTHQTQEQYISSTRANRHLILSTTNQPPSVYWSHLLFILLPPRKTIKIRTFSISIFYFYKSHPYIYIYMILNGIFMNRRTKNYFL